MRHEILDVLDPGAYIGELQNPFTWGSFHKLIVNVTNWNEVK